MIKELFNKEIRSAGKKAEEYLERKEPEFTINGFSLRADEKNRYVFAVIYDDPSLLQKPSPYRLIAIEKENEKIYEIECSPTSEYWIRGRK